MYRPIDTQKAVLIAICDDFMSGEIHTDVEISEIAGVCRKTVYNCKRNARFNRAIREIMPELVAAKSPKYLTMIERHGENDWRPLKFLMEYAGLYTQKSAILSVHARVPAQLDTPQSPQQAVEAYTERFIRLGYDKQRLLREFGAAYNKLTNQ